MNRALRHLPSFAAIAAVSAAAFAGCSPSGTDTSETSPEDPGSRARAEAPARARIEKWRAAFPGVLAAAAGAAHVDRSADGARFGSPRVEVTLPATSGGAAVVRDPRSKVTVAFAIEGGEKKPIAMDGDLAIYAGAGPEGADVLHRARANGTEDLVAFEARPAAEEIAYAVDVRGVAGLRLVARTLELLDAKGSPRLRVAPPWVVDARGVRREASLSVEGCAVSTDPRAPWGRPVTPPGAASCAVVVRWGEQAPAKDARARSGVSGSNGGLVYPVLVDPVWETADDFVEARTQAAAAELDPSSPASQVLFTGGFASGAVGAIALASAEIYFPLERAFAKTDDMQGKRGAHTATRLGDGQVLVAGGLPDTSVTPQPTDALTTMERYDPVTGTFTPVAVPMSPGRALHTATLLADGTVLFAGGTTILGQPTITAVRFDPVGPGFAALPAMSTPRAGHTATPLLNGKVLLAGGFVQSQFALLSAELFDPSNVPGSFAGVTTLGAGMKSQMTKARAFHTATRVDCKTVLISGGTNKADGGVIEQTAELWQEDENPTATADCPAAAATVRGFSPSVVNMIAARSRHTATRLPTGDVVLVGGTNGAADLASTEIFKLTPTPAFTAFVDLAAGQERRDHTAVLVNAGASLGAGRAILIAGGTQGAAALPSAFVLAKNLGEACTIDAECESGFCPKDDGKCCNTACAAECYSCTATAQTPDLQGPNDLGPADGTCRPQAESAPPAGTMITPGQLYDGELPSECNSLSEIHFKCNGKGVKAEAETFPCLPSACGFDKQFCETSCDCNVEVDGNCDPPKKACFAKGWCQIPDGSTEGTCENKGALGTACDKDYQCAAGTSCVDGVCCNSQCTDQCAACNVPGFAGTCSPRSEGLQPLLGGAANRAPCLGAGTACSGACNGSKTTTCDYPGETAVAKEPLCECAGDDCTNGPAVLTTYVCNGDGGVQENKANCGASADNPDGGMKCFPIVENEPVSRACLTECKGDDDCFKDFYCDAASSQCLPLPSAGRCDEAGVALRKTGADPASCGDYICQPDADGPGGACLTACTKKTDCQGELFCDTSGKCVVSVPAAPKAPSCSAAPGGGDRGAPIGGALVALGVIALAGARRRKVSATARRDDR